MAVALLLVFLCGMVVTSTAVLGDKRGCTAENVAEFYALTYSWPIHTFVVGVALGALLIQVGRAQETAARHVLQPVRASLRCTPIPSAVPHT